MNNRLLTHFLLLKLRFVRQAYLLLLLVFFISANLFAQEQRTIRSAHWPGLSPALSFLPSDTIPIMKTLRLGEKLRRMPPDSALVLLTKSYDRSLAIGYNDGIAGSLIELGRIAALKSSPEQAMQLYARALWYSKRAYFYKHFAAACYSNMGGISFFMGQYRQAAQYFDSALSEGIRARLPEGRQHLVITYNNLSVVYMKLDRSDLAMKYIGQAEGLARKYNFNKELRLTLCNKGGVYTSGRNFDQARTEYKEALRLSEQAKDQELIQAARNGLGILALQQQQPALAVSYLTDVIDGPAAYDPYYGDILPRYYLGMAYYNLQQYSKAEKYLVMALERATKTGYFDEELTAHKTLSAIYEAQGRYPGAIREYKLYEQQKDTLLNRDKVKDISELELKYRTVEKDREIAIKDKNILLAASRDRKKNLVIGISLSLLILSAVALALLRYVQAGKLKRVQQQQELDVLKATLAGEEAERIRVGQELHDGVGGYLSAIKINLSSLRMKFNTLSEEELFSRSLQLADEANDELRGIAHNLVPSSLVKNGLGKAVREFCTHLNQNGTPLIEVQETGEPVRMDAVSELAIYRVIQELVHNIIKHARATEASLSLSWQEALLLVTIEDNGVGIGDITTPGIGIDNIKRRVTALQGKFEIESSPGSGTSVYMEFVFPVK